MTSNRVRAIAGRIFRVDEFGVIAALVALVGVIGMFYPTFLRLRIRTASVDATVDRLSGGNQQKVVFAKWLAADPDVVLLDDPTRGVDVGAKADMHGIIRELAADGRIVLISSTDPDELVDLCDRVVVLHRGRLCAELSGAGLTTSRLLHAMSTGEGAQ